jgi:hypothetical protein
MVRNKTLISIVTGSQVPRPDFYDYYNQLVKPPDCATASCHDRSPAHGRNLVIDAAIENEFTHILFIDDDCFPSPDSLLRLLENDVDIVSGLYLTGSYPHAPIVFDVMDERGASGPIYLTDDMRGLVPIKAAGLGFLLVKTEIFKKLEKPYIRLGELDAEQWCDDIGFFKRVNDAGIRSYCDLNVCIGHAKTMIVKPLFKDEIWYTSYDTGGTGVINTPQFVLEPHYAFKEV